MKRGKGGKWRAWAVVGPDNRILTKYGVLGVVATEKMARHGVVEMPDHHIVEVEISAREPNAPRRGRGKR